MHVEFLLEEPSAEAALQNIVPKILGQDVSFTIHPHQGKADLLGKLLHRLRGYRAWLPADWRIVVLLDADDEDCQKLKTRLDKTASEAGLVPKSVAASRSRFQVLNRLAIEELEAWFLGDVEALRAVYPRVSMKLAKKAKYRNPDFIAGGTYPKLSDRSDIIVITDEAHRSQYDIFALNMRNALPNAAFIGFTGTPLMVGEEKTREVFGDYVSIYNFKQSVDDGATVPLYYENRIPELQLTNQDLNADMERLLEEAELDEEQEKKLEREFAREYHLITRDDRLEKLAEDIVAHFLGRGHVGKVMVVSIDKATAVRMVSEDLDAKFKDPDDPFRIVFVCAMWMTGFDVPCCSTIYLDKPMRNHTLMQTIARANRVFRDKVNGLIVDYVGVFRDLQKALAIYGSGSGGGTQPGETPVKDKSALVEHLRQAIAEATAFCAERGLDLSQLQDAQGFARVKALDDAVEAILVNDESKKKYLSLAGNVARIYQAILPDPAANEFRPIRALLSILAEKIRSLAPEVDIADVMGTVENLLDESIAAEGYVIREPAASESTEHLVDLSRIDFEALKARFADSRKRTEAEKLKGAIQHKLKRMLRLNKSRMDYLEKFQQMIEEYNAGATNIELFFTKLMVLAQELTAEEKRSIAEKLSEEELAIFDLLTRPEMKLNKREERQVKKVARDLLTTLKRERLVLDWRKRQQSRAAVRLAIEEILDQLPRSYTPEVYQRKCDAIYQHVYDAYYGQGRSVYAAAA